MQEFSFNVYSKSCKAGIAEGLLSVLPKQPVVLVCIGSDAVAGDTLSPLIGSLLKEFYHLPCYLYGDLRRTMTAKELPLLTEQMHYLHPHCTIVAIDASVGEESEIGLIKLKEGGLAPGKGVGKNLRSIGDFSIMGVVSKRGEDAFLQLKLTRFHLVYEMANAIATALFSALSQDERFFPPAERAELSPSKAKEALCLSCKKNASLFPAVSACPFKKGEREIIA